MVIGFVSPNMKSAVKNRLEGVANENGWGTSSIGRIRFEKDGYEVYFHVDGTFEVTIRDPETREREIIYEYEREDTHSPFYVAMLMYIFESVETVVSECSKE